MPATPATINLLGQEDLGHSPAGRLLTWAVTYGRYIMIGTEIVVLLAFISRFSLDRKLTDLKEEITQKQAILEANSDLEATIRTLQNHTEKVKMVLKDQSKPVDTLTFIQSSLPQDVYIESISFNKGSLTLAAIAGTTGGFSQFLANLSSNKQIEKIELGDIKKSPLTGISFEVNAHIPLNQVKIDKTPTSEQKTKE